MNEFERLARTARHIIYLIVFLPFIIVAVLGFGAAVVMYQSAQHQERVHR